MWHTEGYRMRVTWKAGLLVLILAVAGLGTAGVPVNDAGSGADAGGPASPYQLPRWGGFMGTLAAPGDEDWYRAPAPSDTGPRCVLFDTGATVASQVTLQVGTEAGEATVTSAIDASRQYRAYGGLAVPSFTGALFGITATSAPGATGGDGDDDWEDDESAGATYQAPYGFYLNSTPLASPTAGDGDTGGDAGSTRATSAKAPGPCIAGTLALAIGDSGDIYNFTGRAGQAVTLSFAVGMGADLDLGLYDRLGNRLADVPVGGIVDVTLPENGTYYLAVFGGSLAAPSLTEARTTGSPIPGAINVAYLIGAVSGPERPGGCRPTC